MQGDVSLFSACARNDIWLRKCRQAEAALTELSTRGSVPQTEVLGGMLKYS